MPGPEVTYSLMMTNEYGCRPFRDDGKIIANKCSLCGSEYSSDYVEADGYVICSECAEQMDINDIMDLFGYESVIDLVSDLSCHEV